MSFYVDESNFSLSLSLSLFILKILITLSDLSHYVLSKRTEFLLIKTTHPTCKLAARGFTDLKVQKIDKIKDLCKASPCSMSKAFTRQDSPLVSDLRHASLLCSIQQISLEPLCISLLHKLLELFLLETGPGCQMAVQAHYLAWIYGFESDFFLECMTSSCLLLPFLPPLCPPRIVFLVLRIWLLHSPVAMAAKCNTDARGI